MTSVNTAPKTSTIVNCLTMAIVLDAMVVVGAAILLQVIKTNQSWLVALGMVLILHSFGAKRLVGEKTTIAAGDLMALCSAALFEPTTAIIIAAVNRAVVSYGMKGNYRKALYDISSSAVSMNVAIYSTLGLFPSFGDQRMGMSTAETITAIGFSAASYFTISTCMFAVYEAISTEESFFELMRASFLWTSVSLLLNSPNAFGVYLIRQWNYDEGRQHRKSRIGETLVARGLITDGDLKFALDSQRKSARHAKRLGEILIDMGLIEERHVIEALS